jgi:hypothetical protein
MLSSEIITGSEIRQKNSKFRLDAIRAGSKALLALEGAIMRV